MCSYLTGNNDEDEKEKCTKKRIKKTLKLFKFEDYKKRLEAAQIENKEKHLDKNKVDVDSLKED